MYRTDSGTGDNPHETSGLVPPAGLGALPWWSYAARCLQMREMRARSRLGDTVFLQIRACEHV